MVLRRAPRLCRVSRPADERSQARVQQRDESCRMEIWKFFCDSGGLRERQRLPADHTGRIQYSQCVKNLDGATLLVSPQVNERKCLQRIKREAAGPSE